MKPCALCRNEVVLRDSHLLPKSVYRKLRDDSDPILVSSRATIQSSTQFKCYLLCEDCEQRLNKNGENRVLAEYLQNPDHFVLREKLRKEQPRQIRNDGRWFSGFDLETIDVDSYRYFAASVFWRASVGRWKDPRYLPCCGCLGPKYEEKLRGFLLNQLPFPKEAFLVAFVANEEGALGFATVPCSKNDSGYHMHEFNIPGILFQLWIGGSSNHQLAFLGREWNSNIVFALHNFQRSPAFSQLHQLVQSSSPKGKLRKRQ